MRGWFLIVLLVLGGAALAMPGDPEHASWTVQPWRDGDAFEYVYWTEPADGEPSGAPPVVWYRGQVRPLEASRLPMDLQQGVPAAWMHGDTDDPGWVVQNVAWWWAAGARLVEVEGPGTPRPVVIAPGKLPSATVTGVPHGGQVDIGEASSTVSMTTDTRPDLPSCLLSLVAGARIPGAPFAPCVLTQPVDSNPRQYAVHPARDILVHLDDATFDLLGRTSSGALVMRHGNVTVWHNPDAPLPDRVQVADGDTAHIYALSRYVAGRGSEATPKAADPPKPMRAAPLVDSGLDDRSLQHPYPASAALQDAMEDVDVARFLAAHRDAYVGALNGVLVVDNWMWTTQQLQWDFVLSTPSDAIAVRVAKHVFDGEQVPMAATVRSSPAEPLAPPSALPPLQELLPEGRGLPLWGFQGNTAWGRSIDGAWAVHETAQRSFVERGTVVEDLRLSKTWDTQAGRSVQAQVAPAAAVPEPAQPVRHPVSQHWQPWAATAIALAVVWTVKAPLASLYARISGSELLQHRFRARLVDAITAAPGLHFGALERMTGASHRTLRHHLDKLVAAGILHRQAGHGVVSFFPPGTPNESIVAAQTLAAPTARKILEAVIAHPGTGLADVAREIGVASSTASHHVRRLRDVGLLDTTVAGRRCAIEATDLGRRLAR